jgi:hypothetical protein
VTDRQWTIASLNPTNGQASWLRGLGESYGSHLGVFDDTPLLSLSGSNLFIIGTAYGSGAQFGGLSVSIPGGRGQYFARYDTNGNPQMATNFGSPTTSTWASTANASGIYVSGDFDSYSQFGSDVIAAPVFAQNDLGPAYFTQPFVAKFDTNGNPLWARNGVSSYLANFRGIATSSDGVWASGFVKITNSIEAKFGTNSIFSDDYVPSSGGLGTIDWTQAGMIAKITESVTGPAQVTLLDPQLSGTSFQFQFLSQSGHTHYVLSTTNLITGPWITNSTITGDGTTKLIAVPYVSPSQKFFRVSTQ